VKIILHACCGPCSTVPIRDLGEQGHQIIVFYSNSNIHPEAEYIRRRDTCAKYAREMGLEFVEGTYNPNDWVNAIGDCRKYGVERCRRCYRMRFQEPAEYAAEVGADAIASSLTISPYQFTSAINEELSSAAKAHGVLAIESDYRSEYRDSVVLSREAGMYRQNFCGCMYSQVEAQEMRDAARAERRARREVRRLARSEGITMASMKPKRIEVSLRSGEFGGI
jgi:predicted adenine nucleotide alpha hydrolase (AANH) superfamily ATPase